ncbi:hypothetical protein ASZ90_010281 [hydrocarbon metagenome]|uniref:Uncharacterized protein n=1 Tax=hydrocarbon metagenome TaxID=938273 RepID=A0A0W8FGH3_9ZZZZ
MLLNKDICSARKSPALPAGGRCRGRKKEIADPHACASPFAMGRAHGNFFILSRCSAYQCRQTPATLGK